MLRKSDDTGNFIHVSGDGSLTVYLYHKEQGFGRNLYRCSDLKEAKVTDLHIAAGVTKGHHSTFINLEGRSLTKS
jgi:hypothetical protein